MLAHRVTNALVGWRLGPSVSGASGRQEPTSTPAPTRPAVKPTATFRISERATPRRSSEFQIRCHRIDAGACTGIVDVAARRARDADAADDAALRLDRHAAAQHQRFGDEVGGIGLAARLGGFAERSEEHTSELPSLMRTSYAV